MRTSRTSKQRSSPCFGGSSGKKNLSKFCKEKLPVLASATALRRTSLCTRLRAASSAAHSVVLISPPQKTLLGMKVVPTILSHWTRECATVAHCLESSFVRGSASPSSSMRFVESRPLPSMSHQPSLQQPLCGPSTSCMCRLQQLARPPPATAEGSSCASGWRRRGSRSLAGARRLRRPACLAVVALARAEGAVGPDGSAITPIIRL